MKNVVFLSVMSLLMFAACSEDDSKAPVENEYGAVTFELSAVNEIEGGAVTRSPIYSQEAVQHVTQVNVYAFKSNGTDYLFEKSYNITGWTDGTTFKRYAVPDENKLALGDYKFLAMGVGADNAFTVTTPAASTKFEDMAATIATSGNETEIFAGFAPYTIIAQGSRVSIQMIRKVAGVLGYFKNVPTTIDGSPVKYLRLTVSASNLQVNLSTAAGSTAGVTPFNIINVDLSTQGTANDVFTGNTVEAGVVKVPNSQLNGSYLVPVNNITLTLGLYGADGTTALRTWAVSSPGVGTTFDILANHFYTLGRKEVASGTGGTDPNDPNDDDAPIDLLTDQTITVTISPNWTIIHDLVLQTP
ncbi:FimB/Mfa2 family fimbrial subunit [Parabacteroides faecis]|uniref:FimB/Mfa2 family fimbrial subunit n=1 Tax=Parabacteroides faecis TaxID=1217282 RepID=UPI0035221749